MSTQSYRRPKNRDFNYYYYCNRNAFNVYFYSTEKYIFPTFKFKCHVNNDDKLYTCLILNQNLFNFFFTFSFAVDCERTAIQSERPFQFQSGSGPLKSEMTEKWDLNTKLAGFCFYSFIIIESIVLGLFRSISASVDLMRFYYCI